ncbi:MAG: thymidine phosphorylase [Thermoanaerobaculia bacterium]
MSSPYQILARKRRGLSLGADDLAAIVSGASDGTWSEAELAAFLMAAAIRGLDQEETHRLTLAMMQSGDCWDLASDIPGVVDKHSTGGVGDKVSLVLAPLMAAARIPIIMLTGRGLGHTAGTADKLEVIPGLDLELSRARCLEAVEQTGMAIGVATADIAPADRRLYALRDRTATVDSLPLIVASILSKKLATGAEAVAFDVKTGDGAFMSQPDEAVELAHRLVETCAALDRRASALVTDMSQPLGDWSGHSMEVSEALHCLAGDGPRDVMEVVFEVAMDLAQLADSPARRRDFEDLVNSGLARETFARWAEIQGADVQWLAAPTLEPAPHEVVCEASCAGYLSHVATRELGLLLAEASHPEGALGTLDEQVALRSETRLGDSVEEAQLLARLYLRRPDPRFEKRFRACFTIADEAVAPALIRDRIAAA